MYQRSLVPLDGSPLSDRVLPYVRTLGRKLGAKVELFRVFDPHPEYFYPEPYQFPVRHDSSEHCRDEVMTDLGSAKINLERSGIPATAVMHGPETVATKGVHRYGTTAEHIVTESEKDPEALIVMSTHVRSGAGHASMGTVSDKLL